jgi:arylsulfatase A-like enzyme
MTGPKVAQSESEWLNAARSVLPWLIPATFSLYLKYHLLHNKNGRRGGYGIAAHLLGRVDLTSWEKFSYYRADLLVTFLLAPLVLLLVSRYLLPNRWRTAFFVLLSLGITVVLYLELSSFDAAGEFLSITVMSAAIQWGILHDRSAIFTTLRFTPLAGIVGLTAILTGWRLLVNWRRRIGGNSIMGSRWYFAPVAVLSGLSAMTMVAWASPFATTPFHKNSLGWVLRSLANHTDDQTLEFSVLHGPELQNRYRAMASFTPAAQDARYWAKAKGCNVLFFALETAPARVLPADGDLSDFPNLRRLRERSLVGVSHYTTFPATHQALFSILSSWYPSTAATNLETRQPDLAVPGLIATLSELGYDTAFFGPFNFEGLPDAEMYKSLGFQRQVYPPNETGNSDFFSTFDSNQSARTRMALDVASVNLLKRDMERDLSQGRQFAYLIEPEVSHGPWADLQEGGKEKNVERRGRNILQIPDQFLGEIMEVLERHNQLENTVIVVVGDHGIRDAIEDPNLPSGVIDDYSFHVPLLIYAPKALEHSQNIPYITSHIDIAPTVRSLLGIEQGKSFEQGTPVWDPDLVNRTTFFFGRDYVAADGYYARGKFYSWNRMNDAVYQNTQMSFDGINLVPPNSSPYNEVTRAINSMAGLGEVWAMRFSDTKPARNYVALTSKQ